jgi:hypothetical protein
MYETNVLKYIKNLNRTTIQNNTKSDQKALENSTKFVYNIYETIIFFSYTEAN